MLVDFNVDMEIKFLFIFSFSAFLFFFNEKFIGERLQFYGNYRLGYISFEEFSKFVEDFSNNSMMWECLQA